MFPIINIGPLAIQAAGMIIMLSLLVGLWVMGIFSRNLRTAGNIIENCILTGLFAGLFSARIGFMLQNLTFFFRAPLSLFSLTPSMLNPQFGVLIGMLSAVILAQKQQLPLWPSLDTLSPLIFWIFIGFHLADYANGNAYGLPTVLPWGVELWGAIRHPVQIYLLLICAGLFVWFLIKTNGFAKTGFLRSGILFNITLLCLAFFTIFTRAFVAQGSRVGNYDIHQLAGVIILLLALGLIYRINFKDQKQQSVFIGIGSNSRQEDNIPSAINEISQNFRIRRKSSIYQTEAVKTDSEGTQFWNLVIEVGTKLPYPELRSELKMIEKQFGRNAGDKTHVPLDLDILVFDGDVFTYQGKTIPDPDIFRFQYIAKPIKEMSPDFRHPANGRLIAEIIDKMNDQTRIEKIVEVPDGFT